MIRISPTFEIFSVLFSNEAPMMLNKEISKSFLAKITFKELQFRNQWTMSQFLCKQYPWGMEDKPKVRRFNSKWLFYLFFKL